jgi:uncharacterized protein (TIGR02271 family)
MANTVIGLFPNESDVQRVMDDLTQHGFSRREINRHDKVDADLRNWLEDQGVPAREAEDYVVGIRNGGKLVVLEASDDRAEEAVRIMRRHETGISDRPAPARGASTERGRKGSGLGAGTAATPRRGEVHQGDVHKGEVHHGEETLEVTEEVLDVGKREVDKGGVRVRTYVTERPVEEDVRVRSETVNVERRPVDRPLREGDVDRAFQERTIEMTEHDEEVVVGKRARVIEEVVLSKDVQERTEKVRDTVRRTDVEVERADGAGRTAGFDDDRDHYRGHHREHFGTGRYQYEDYEPAYRYGTALAEHADYQGREWRDVSPAAREHWERQNQGTWTEFEPAVRYAYDRSRGRGGRR